MTGKLTQYSSEIRSFKEEKSVEYLGHGIVHRVVFLFFFPKQVSVNNIGAPLPA